jgi:hypothetical protein
MESLLFETSFPSVETPLDRAMRELDAAKALLNKRKKELEQAVHAFNEASELHFRAIKAFNFACRQKVS